MSKGLPVSQVLPVVDRVADALKLAAGQDKRLSATDRQAAAAAGPDAPAVLDHFVSAALDISGTTVTAADLDAVAQSAKAALLAGAGTNLVLSQAERARLPMLPRIAAAVASGVAVQASSDVAHGWAEGRDFRGVWRHSLRTQRDASSLPDSIKQSVSTWMDWEDADLGSVYVYAVRNTLPRLFAVHTTTDGDNGFLEMFDEEGRALASGATGVGTDGAGNLEHRVAWDASFGAVRAALTRLQPPPGASYQSRFEAAFQAATGAPIAPTVMTASEGPTHIDLELQLGAATASGRLQIGGGRDVLTVSRVALNEPVQSAGMLANLQAALRADARYPDASVIAVGQRSTLNETFFTVLFTTQGVERTARVDVRGAGLQPSTLGTMDDANCAREIAIALATTEALRQARQAGPLAELEVVARTFNGGARLGVEEPASADRYGFDPLRDHKQLLVSGLWGSCAAYVTFTRDGGHRLDWMN